MEQGWGLDREEERTRRKRRWNERRVGMRVNESERDDWEAVVGRTGVDRSSRGPFAKGRTLAFTPSALSVSLLHPSLFLSFSRRQE